MKKYITISGKDYECKNENGIPMVKRNGEWMNVSDFLSTLTKQERFDMALIGVQAIKDRKTGEKMVSYQRMSNELHSSRNN